MCLPLRPLRSPTRARHPQAQVCHTPPVKQFFCLGPFSGRRIQKWCIFLMRAPSSYHLGVDCALLRLVCPVVCWTCGVFLGASVCWRPSSNPWSSRGWRNSSGSSGVPHCGHPVSGHLCGPQPSQGRRHRAGTGLRPHVPGEEPPFGAMHQLLPISCPLPAHILPTSAPLHAHILPTLAPLPARFLGTPALWRTTRAFSQASSRLVRFVVLWAWKLTPVCGLRVAIPLVAPPWLQVADDWDTMDSWVDAIRLVYTICVRGKTDELSAVLAG